MTSGIVNMLAHYPYKEPTNYFRPKICSSKQDWPQHYDHLTSSCSLSSTSLKYKCIRTVCETHMGLLTLLNEMTSSPLQHTKKKQDTAGDWTLSQQSQECHHRSLLLFCCCCKGKSKTWRNKQEVCSSRKRKPLHAWLLHYPVTTRGFLFITRLKLEDKTTGFPNPRHYPRHCIGIWLIPRYLFIHTKNATIPASLVILKAVFPLQFGRTRGSKGQWGLSCLVWSCNGKRDKQCKPPHPPPT